MIDKREYLLSCVAEECMEVAQRVTKAIRFGLFETQPGQDLNNWQRICQEYDDLLAAFDLLTIAEGLMYQTEEQAFKDKKNKILLYLEHARKVGQIT